MRSWLNAKIKSHDRKSLYRSKRMFEKYRFWHSPAPRLEVGANGTKSFEKDWKLDAESLLVP
ncbi:hypothetical protein LBWT_21080 [Leptolyngbya boryana IAM M-101]|nr:hypothetical protein LBWT_21080 [Leptolyngbya boryana IAM M-101]BAS62543.1 hypothetical protein LBDG_21080 [Leptolyngbya boryana dg5]